jgi:hypothetical protein
MASITNVAVLTGRVAVSGGFVSSTLSIQGAFTLPMISRS